MVSPLVLPYRCTACDQREFKFRFLDTHPDAHKERDEEEEVETEATKHEAAAPAAITPSEQAKTTEKAES